MFSPKNAYHRNNQLREERNVTLERKQERNTKNKNSATYANKNSLACSTKIKIIVGFEITVITQERTKEIHLIFYNGSDYDYHFVIKALTEGFKGQCEFLGENTEKCITFLVPIKKTKLKQQDNNMQNKTHRQGKIYGQLIVNCSR